VCVVWTARRKSAVGWANKSAQSTHTPHTLTHSIVSEEIAKSILCTSLGDPELGYMGRTGGEAVYEVENDCNIVYSVYKESRVLEYSGLEFLLQFPYWEVYSFYEYAICMPKG